jgi:S1-C subfamily serine protease
MLGCNWVDLLIIVLLIPVALAGLKIGLLTQLMAILSFFAGLFAAGFVVPHLLPIHDTALRDVVNICLVLGVAACAGFYGYELSRRLHWHWHDTWLMHGSWPRRLERLLGSVTGVVAGLVLVWLVGVGIGRLPFEGLSNSVSDAFIVQHLTRALPPAPAVLNEFSEEINPNAPPAVVAQPRPHADFNYSPEAARAAAAAGGAAVVRITSFGCGGIVSGSGFTVAHQLVATNAHVLAGVKRPIIKYRNQSYEGVPVYFDAKLDLALLRTYGLPAPSLALATNAAPLNSSGAVIGYPGGNYQAIPAIIRDTFAVSANDIYSQGLSGRGVYVVQAHIVDGNSGGPLVLQNGTAAGIIFSRATDGSDYGYALTSQYIAQAVQQASDSGQRVSTGACTVR